MGSAGSAVRDAAQRLPGTARKLKPFTQDEIGAEKGAVQSRHERLRPAACGARNHLNLTLRHGGTA